MKRLTVFAQEWSENGRHAKAGTRSKTTKDYGILVSFYQSGDDQGTVITRRTMSEDDIQRISRSYDTEIDINHKTYSIVAIEMQPRSREACAVIERVYRSGETGPVDAVMVEFRDDSNRSEVIAVQTMPRAVFNRTHPGDYVTVQGARRRVLRTVQGIQDRCIIGVEAIF